MDDLKRQLLSWLEADRDGLIGFMSGFLQARSANPPGDTTEAADHISRYLQARRCRTASSRPSRTCPTSSAPTRCGGEGGTVLNGHIDVFPRSTTTAGRARSGRQDLRPRCLRHEDGTAAGVFAYAYLHRLREHLKGKLTDLRLRRAVGRQVRHRYLFETIPDEVTGDCCLNGEPSGVNNIRFMEKGTLRFRVTARAPGGHGGYPHLSANPVKIIAAIVGEIERFHGRGAPMPAYIAAALDTPEAVAGTNKGLGVGAADVVRFITVNPGVITGGLKVNQIAPDCLVEFDLRIPVGFDRDDILKEIQTIVGAHPEAAIEMFDAHSYPPSAADPNGEMVRILQDNVKALKGFTPVPLSSLGGSDSRYWRYDGIPAYLYGPSPVSMGRRDEHVTVDEILHIVTTHVLSAFDYLQVAPEGNAGRGRQVMLPAVPPVIRAGTDGTIGLEAL
jgi:succinyl-diaminopimelate desuccinylase